jgi:hypothetical protein
MIEKKLEGTKQGETKLPLMQLDVRGNFVCPSKPKIKRRALPRCVTWCGISTAITRAKRATSRIYQEYVLSFPRFPVPRYPDQSLRCC